MMMKSIRLFGACCALFVSVMAGDCLADGTLRMITEATFPPYEFMRGDDIVGLDVEICRAIAGRLGKELQVENADFDAVIPAVISGKADLAAAGITITEDRRKNVDFSKPYIRTGIVVIYRKDNPFTGVEQLKGRKIGVQGGTTSETYVLEELKQQPDRLRSPAEAVAGMRAGRCDFVIADINPAKNCIKGEPDLAISDFITYEEYAIAIRKDRPELLAVVNAVIDEMKRDGSIERWSDEFTAEADGLKGGGGGSLVDDFKNCFTIGGRWRYLAGGLAVTIEVALAAIIVGLLIGFLVSMVRYTHDRYGGMNVANAIAKVYLTIIRGTPMVVQLLITYYIILRSVDSKVFIAIIAFGINSGAYQAEIIRAGIASIEEGQMEAGRALGLSYWSTMFKIILPQAIRNVLPALGNEFIVLIKDTAIVGYIALVDLAKGGDIIRSQTYSVYLPYLTVAAIYLILVMTFTWLLGRLERHLRKTGARVIAND